MKKRMLFLLFATSASSAFAFCDCLQGYVGLAGGISALSSDSFTRNLGSFENYKSVVGGTSGLIGGVLGCQTVIGDTYLAVQGNVFYNSTATTSHRNITATGQTNYLVRLKSDVQYGADARVGLWFCGVAPYFLAGAEGGKWQSRLENESETSFRGIPAGATLKYSKRLWGPKVGGGVIFPISTCIAVNMEYSHTWFGKMERRLVDSATGATWRYKHSIAQSSILFGLNYLF
jgi:opacity protein-like surface antigen